jgi:hypothetical protein
VRAFPGFPPRARLLYESEIDAPAILREVGREPAYFVWVHFPPSRDAEGNLRDYRKDYKEETILADPDRAIGLSRLKPS